jgi:hypothetical protein
MSAFRKLAAAAAVLASVQSAEAMNYSYRIDKERLVINAAGEIELDEGQRFLNFTIALPAHAFHLLESDGKAVIVFNSGGGRVGGAFKLATVIEDYRLTTGVARGGRCMSACVIAWVDGVRKTAAPDASIGVHRAGADGTAANTASSRQDSLVVTGVMAKWFRSKGAPDNVVARTLKTPFENVYILTDADLASWKVTVVK